MANTFNNNTTVTLGTDTTLYTAPNTNAADRAIVVGLLLTNTHATDEVQITLKHGTDVILNAVRIPVNTALEVCRGNKFVLANNETLVGTVTGGTANAMISALEITAS